MNTASCSRGATSFVMSCRVLSFRVVNSHGVLGHYSTIHLSAKMKVDRVPTERSLLTKVLDIDTLDALLDSRCVEDHQVSSLKLGRVWVTLQDDVARQQRDLRSKVRTFLNGGGSQDGLVQLQTDIPGLSDILDDRSDDAGLVIVPDVGV